MTLYLKLLTINYYCIKSMADPERRSRSTRVGAVLYVEGSAYDHSCSPNAMQWFSGTKLQIKALRDFDTNDEPVVIHYVDLKMRLAERRAKLLRQYYFRCECTRCSAEDGGKMVVDYAAMTRLEDQSRLIAHEFAATDANTKDKMAAMDLARSYCQVRTDLLTIYSSIYGSNHPYVQYVGESVNDLAEKLAKMDEVLSQCEDRLGSDGGSACGSSISGSSSFGSKFGSGTTTLRKVGIFADRVRQFFTVRAK